jgi:hypothetical protein
VRWGWLIWGIAAAAFYIAAAVVFTTGVPVRLLYDGEMPPPPYRWMRPPGDISGPYQPPQQGSGTIAFTATGSRYSVVGTDDAQAWVVFSKDAVVREPGESEARVRITPLDPSTIPAPPPGMNFDGNAYRIQAVYAKSGQPVKVREVVTVMLRYPRHAQDILHVSGSRWVVLATNKVEVTLQLFASTKELGLFVAGSR